METLREKDQGKPNKNKDVENMRQLLQLYQSYKQITKEKDNIGDITGSFIFFQGSDGGAKYVCLGEIDIEKILLSIGHIEKNEQIRLRK